MATTRQRRVNASPPAQERFDYEEEDRVYTEEDYALPEGAMPDEWEDGQDAYPSAGWTGESYMPDEAFQPDEAELPEDGAWADEAFPEEDNDYHSLFEGIFDDTGELDPLDDDLLTDEERAELKRSHWQLLAGLADFAGVILGTAAILVLVTLLVSLINWLVNDMNQSFILLQKHL